MAFMIIANKSPLLDLGSELSLENLSRMAFWSCAPELSICSFLIYATQTLTPGEKGQELLLVCAPK